MVEKEVNEDLGTHACSDIIIKTTINRSFINFNFIIVGRDQFKTNLSTRGATIRKL